MHKFMLQKAEMNRKNKYICCMCCGLFFITTALVIFIILFAGCMYNSYANPSKIVKENKELKIEVDELTAENTLIR